MSRVQTPSIAPFPFFLSSDFKAFSFAAEPAIILGMFEILTSAEMKKADLAAIESGMPALGLIRSAAAGLAQSIRSNMPPGRILFLCGTGNNGADGFIAAEILRSQGWEVRVACLVKTKELKNDAAKSAKEFQGEIESLNSNLSVHNTDLVVDAVFGTGFDGELPPELVTLFDKVRAKKIPVIAADVPSGVNATTGTIAEGALKPAMTVVFCRKKIAHVLQPSRAFCGKQHLVVVPIPDADIAALGTQTFENTPALWLNDFPYPRAEMHKYDRGHVVVYGGADRTGAACLAAHAAQRSGAGVVSITAHTSESALIYKLYRASIMVDTWQTADDFKTLLRDARKNAAIIGPGAGMDDKTREAVLAALDFNKTLVLDADALTVFKDTPEALFKKLSPRHVLTPHEGEFARAAAKTANAIVVLKGSDTVIAAPDGTAVINTNAPPILAIAGAGDVLAGLISGFAAQGMPAFMASIAAVWLHAAAAKSLGTGLTAEDIINHIPQTLKTLFDAARGDT